MTAALQTAVRHACSVNASSDPQMLLANIAAVLRQINDTMQVPELEHLARLVEGMSLDDEVFDPAEDDDDDGDDDGPIPPSEVMDQLHHAVDDDDAPFPREPVHQLLDWLAGEIDGSQEDAVTLRAIGVWLTTLGVAKAPELDTGASCAQDESPPDAGLCSSPLPVRPEPEPGPSAWALRGWVWVRRPWRSFLERDDQLVRLVPADDDGHELVVYLRVTTEQAYVKKGKLPGGTAVAVVHAQHKANAMLYRARAVAAKATARVSTG